MEQTNCIFTPDQTTDRPVIQIPGERIASPAAVLDIDVSDEVCLRGDRFADEIRDRFFADFEKTAEAVEAGYADIQDRMVHVSTFLHIGGTVYMTYYANTQTTAEDPNFQTARIVYCPDDNPDAMTYCDVQSVGDLCGGRRVNMVYDTILAQRDEHTLLVLWTARVGETYYRLCRPFDLDTRTLGEICVNRFRVGEIENDFSTTGITSALAANGIGVKTMYSDIGIMQKFTSRIENGMRYYYTGTYSGDFNCIIKSRDFITWEYVSQPDFPNLSKWENAVYLLDDICYYFVRQHDETPYGFLTSYDLRTGTWATPVLIGDCQSRGDFIFFAGSLYLFHAPIDREHIGIVRINTQNLAESEIIVQAKMHSSCFYPFIQYYDDTSLAMSYTVARQHIRLAQFSLEAYTE